MHAVFVAKRTMNLFSSYVMDVISHFIRIVILDVCAVIKNQREASIGNLLSQREIGFVNFVVDIFLNLVNFI
jgi:hypothetical protein